MADPINLDDPDDMPAVRETLARAGIDPIPLSDEEARDALAGLLEQTVPAPAIPAGSPPVSGRLWLSEVLTAGGMREPDDPEQRATLDDEGPTIDLGVLGVLAMRHMSGARPRGWTDEDLAEQLGQPVEDLARGQRLLDEVAEHVGRAATPAPRWWLEP